MSGIKKYFETNAKQWVLDGYNDDGYNYPIALHRARIVSQFISGLRKKRLNIIDLGCGGGDLTFYLAKMGHVVVGVDQSKAMIDLAESRRGSLPQKIQGRVQFLRGSIEKTKLDKKFDVVAAMGLIGYLPNDKTLFDVASRFLKPNGYFLVSCRNRLFNMQSISFRTKKEIKNGEAVNLIGELQELYAPVPAKDANNFIAKFKKIAINLPAKASFSKKLMLSPSEKLCPETPASNFEPRQNTPNELKETAFKCGFAPRAYYGVHPHLIDPNLNKLFPPKLFNKISGCLEALEHLPISLAWSSVFIGVFQKTKGKRL